MPDRAGMTLLVLADPERWADKVAAESLALGLDAPVMVDSAQQAIAQLAGGSPVCGLVLQPGRAGALAGTLADMTAGEADSPTRLILVGDPGRRFAARGAVRADEQPGWLGRALAAPGAPRGGAGLSDGALLDLLSAGCLRARYQPIVSVADRRPTGVEALARLQHPSRGTLPPSMFVPQAEAAGMGWTLFRLLAGLALKDWTSHGWARLGMKLGLNIAVREMLRPDLPAWLDAHCAASGMPPAMLVLEMTETQPVRDTAALRRATRMLADRGFQLMIDDVGPGMRDPADLLDLNFAAMKIDRVLVAAAADSAEARQVLVRLLGHARQAGLTTVAEGVEDRAGWERVRDQGFDLVQGFHAGRPLPAAALATWFQAWTAPPPLLPRPALLPASYHI